MHVGVDLASLHINLFSNLNAFKMVNNTVVYKLCPSGQAQYCYNFETEMDLKILVFMLMNVYCIYATPYDMRSLMKRGQKYCGDQLWRVVSIACRGNYNNPDKRVYNDIFDYQEYDEAAENGLNERNVIFPFLKKEAVKSLIPLKFRKSRGIVYECCYKSCSSSHLHLYCAPK